MSPRRFSGPFDRSAAAHLWRRAGFGADRARLERSVANGLEATLEELFALREHEPAYLHGIEPLLATGEIAPLQAWWMGLILADRAPLVERLTLFWHDHFATSHDKVADVRMMHAQIELFRGQGLGDFRRLLHAVAKDPAMLVWLDGVLNKKGQPNENFAREVMELFALGIGHYHEHDIQEAARAFTGWGVDGRRFVFREQYHDAGTKRIFDQAGDYDGEAAIERILAHPAVPRHIARRLLEEFIGPAPEEAVVEEWAQVLLDEDWSIERCLARLFASERFYSPAARRSKIAGPVELLARTWITLGGEGPAAALARAADAMGQALLRPPSVKGWDGGRSWIHAGSWLARHHALIDMAYGEGETRVRLAAAAALGDPSGRAALVRAASELLLCDCAGAALLAQLDEAAAAAASEQEALRRVLALTLTSPEYHLT